MIYKSSYHLWSSPTLKWYWRILTAPIYACWIAYECLKGTPVHLELGEANIPNMFKDIPVCRVCGKQLSVPYNKYLGYLVYHNPDCPANKRQ